MLFRHAATRWLGLLGAVSLGLLQAAEPVTPQACPAGIPLGNFDFSVLAPGQPEALPLRQVNRLQSGYTLRYRPLEDRRGPKVEGEVAAVLVPLDAFRNAEAQLVVLEPKDARKEAAWTIPAPASIAGIVYGPRGLDAGKVKRFINGDRNLIVQLADYAERTQQTETLVQALSQVNERARGGDVDTALQSFARSAYGPRLNANASLDQQTLTLINALNQPLANYDPLAPEPRQRLAQSASLAAAVAGLFFGQTVGLAAAGGAMFVNLRTLAFPNTEFRSAYAQADAPRQLTLCAKREPPKSRTKLAYLWAARVTNADVPKVALGPANNVPLGAVTAVPVTGSAEDVQVLSHARDWRLLSPDNKEFRVPVRIVRDSRSAELDLRGASLPPGSYRLEGRWDWEPLPAKGELIVRPFPVLAGAAVTDESQARLLAGAGKVPFQLHGADFQFIERVAVHRKGDQFSGPAPIPFRLPRGRGAGVQGTLNAELDTTLLTPGAYHLLLTQTNGQTQELPLELLPKDTALQGLPLLADATQKEQFFTLRGEGLQRIESLSAPGLTFRLGPASEDGRRRDVYATLEDQVHEGEQRDLLVQFAQTSGPLRFPKALLMSARRGKIVSVQPALPTDLPLELMKGEIPGNTVVSFSILTKNVNGAASLRLSCAEPSLTLRTVELRSGETKHGAKLQVAGNDLLYLSLDPATIGGIGCTLRGVLEADGGAESVTLGKVVRLPRVVSFELTNEKVEEGVYVGILKGQDLETIEKAGWNADDGLAVLGLPTPEGDQQSLRIAVKWPSPLPRAPLYFWLRGEEKGRESKLR